MSSGSWNVKIPSGNVTLEGDLRIPAGAKGIVVFVHGSGSSRHSPRNRHVAKSLEEGGRLGTLLFDLLTPQEEVVDNVSGELRFNVNLLAQRVLDATEWLMTFPQAQHLQLGYFGASTGGAGALIAAASSRHPISAVVSRGGRPDLAGEILPKVTTPTLLIVGGDDEVVIKLNQRAYDKLNCEKDMRIIPGATHLFEEPGALEKVSHLAREWFERHLSASGMAAH